MKQVYALFVATCFVAVSASAQTFYWIGSANGDWSSGSNWSLSQGGSAAGDYPQDASDNAIFSSNATVLIGASGTINSLSVAGSSTVVKITGSAGDERILTLLSTNPASPALNISAGCLLEHSAQTDSWFRIILGPNAVGEINGEWLFTGDVDDNAIASFYLGETGFTTRLNVNSGGSIAIGAKGFIEPNENTGDEYLVFKSGSKLRLLADGPVVPAADYAASSTIEITGVIDASVIFEEAVSVGNITYSCPGQANGSNHLYLSLLTFTVGGNLNVLNTNNNELTLINFNSTTGMPSRDGIINGNLNIQGSSVVSVALNDGLEFANNLYVEGNLVMNGTALYLHSGSYISSKATTLYVKGNIEHTAGIISTASLVVNEASHLYVIELNGTSVQSVSSHNSNFDNAQHQVTLRVNNSAGISLLTDLAVGRLSFNSANRGIINTGTNVLTINNTASTSVSGIVLEMPATPGNAFVNGILRRRTASTEPLLMPVGAGALYRAVSILPSSATTSTFEARYVNSAFGGNMQAPVRDIAPYYWQVSRVGTGADAAVQLNIPGTLPGALTGYDLGVGRYDGSNWVSTRGTTGIMVSPGTSSAGTVRSAVQSSFGSFTISLESENALPTYLLSFDARKLEKESAILTWEITDNSTPALFEVMRSSDGQNFHSIAQVPGTDGQRKYQFTDPALAPGNNHYRLHMLDKDGTVTQSIIRLVTRDIGSILIHSLMPTMVHSTMNARISSSLSTNIMFVITDAGGRAVHQQRVSIQAGTHDVRFDVSKLIAGTYQVTGYSLREKLHTFRFIKL
jgi:hypothetical protein